MITHIKTKGFKGLDLNGDLAKKTIFTGPNTAGKSARAAAIAFALMGFIPFAAKTNKKASDLLDDYGNGESMLSEVTCGGVLFERRLWRKENGSVSTKLRIDKKGASKSEFAVALDRAGDPRIIDLNEFIGMSDPKKIETLFKLYPPKGDLKNLDSDIEKSKKRISVLNDSIRNSTGAINNLTKSKTDIELPAGSLAETQKEINDLLAGIDKAREALRIAEQKNAEEQKAIALANKGTDDSQAGFDKAMDENSPPAVDPAPTEPKEVTERLAETDPYRETHVSMPDGHTVKSHGFNSHGSQIESCAAESIKKIIDTMVAADCSMCAGLLVAKSELKNYEGAK